jgi:hypothetical protein
MGNLSEFVVVVATLAATRAAKRARILARIPHQGTRGYHVSTLRGIPSATFYCGTKECRMSRDFLAGEKIVAVLPFESRVRKNGPVVPLTIGGLPFIGS